MLLDLAFVSVSRNPWGLFAWRISDICIGVYHVKNLLPCLINPACCLKLWNICQAFQLKATQQSSVVFFTCKLRWRGIFYYDQQFTFAHYSNAALIVNFPSRYSDETLAVQCYFSSRGFSGYGYPRSFKFFAKNSYGNHSSWYKTQSFQHCKTVQIPCTNGTKFTWHNRGNKGNHYAL